MKFDQIMEIEKETKGTIRYKAIVTGKPAPVMYFYICKWALKEIPKQIKLTVEGNVGEPIE